jgi:hypothetical protein
MIWDLTNEGKKVAGIPPAHEEFGYQFTYDDKAATKTAEIADKAAIEE